MKHDRKVYRRYRVLLQQAQHRHARQLHEINQLYEDTVYLLKKRRDREVGLLPDLPRATAYKEDPYTIRYCATCKGEMLTATRENAERLAQSYELRGSCSTTVGHALAALRFKNVKYCCYHCQMGYGEHSSRCKLKLEVDTTIMEADASLGAPLQ